jgi:hypothetical protein
MCNTCESLHRARDILPLTFLIALLLLLSTLCDSCVDISPYHFCFRHDHPSGKSLSVDGKAKLKNQIIDAPWVTPGQFTQAPSLDCIFSQCYSIKSWLDLRHDHVAIVHCSNGRSRSGILIACLLKYIGAFDHASAAFDFFCSAR